MKWQHGKLLNIPMIVLCLIIGVGIWVWFGERGFLRLYQTESERQAYIERIRQLARENQSLLDEIHRLRTDMQYVETVARRQLDLIKENEIIYRFDSNAEAEASHDDLLKTVEKPAGQQTPIRKGGSHEGPERD